MTDKGTKTYHANEKTTIKKTGCAGIRFYRHYEKSSSMSIN